jgi:RimJ/RimL family protein N-acetyltransferase
MNNEMYSPSINTAITTFESLESFSTDRLHARRITADDLNNFSQMDSDPIVMATLGGVCSLQDTQARLAWNLKQWDDNGHGVWMFYLKTTGEWIGRASLRRMIVDSQQELELGYALMPQFWKQGFATEMARACIEIAFDKLGYENIVCFTMPTNTASRQVMEKLGFQYEKDCLHANIPHVFYRL